MMYRPILCCFVGLLMYSRGASSEDQLTVTPAPETCELVDYTIVHYCKALDSYSMTSFPNSRNHMSQSEAFSEMQQFREAIISNCSGAILDFLCSYYIPICFEVNDQVMQLLPCRSLCEQVYNNCNDDLLASNNSLLQSWPDHLNCTLFPNSAPCFGPSDPSMLVLPALIPGINAPVCTVPTSSSSSTAETATQADSSTIMMIIDQTASTVTTPSSRTVTTTTTPTPTSMERPDLPRPDSAWTLRYSIIISLVSVMTSVLMVKYL